MFRRSLSLLLTIVVFASVNVAALVSAQANTQLPGSAVVSEVTADLQGRLKLESVAAFDATGGWAVIEPDSNNPELFFYLGTDPVTNELSGVRRPIGTSHPAASFVAALDASQLVSRLDAASTVDVAAITSGANAIESMTLTGAAGFDASGGFAVADATTSAPTLFYYSSTDLVNLVLGGIQAPGDSSLATSTSVTAVDVAAVFPLVVDPPPVTVPGVDPPPVTVDPPPVGGQDLGGAIQDPPPVTVDPPPVGGQDLGGAIQDPPPVTVDPPPVGGQDLGGLIPDPPPQTLDPPPVGGQDLSGVDPPPVFVDPPPVGPYTVEPLNPSPIYVAGIDPPPVVIDAPPYAIKGVDDPAPVVVDPPPYAIAGVDPAPVYLDPPAVQVPGADPAPVTYDPAPQTVTFPDPPPVGGTYVNPPDGGTITYDPPAVGDTHVNPPNPGSITVDAPPVGGGVVYLPDAPPICADPAEILRILDEIGTIPPLPPIALSTAVICFDPSDGEFIQIPALDAPPVTVTVPDACPETSGCYVTRVDPDPVTATVDDPCPGSGCYVEQVDAAAPAPIYLNPDAVTVDAPPVAPRTVDLAPVFADPAPVPGATGNPAAVTIADPGPVPGATGDPAAVILDPSPIGGVVVDPPPLCDSYSDPASGPSCTVPRVDASPVGVDLPPPCAQFGSMVCRVPVVDQSPITVDPPHPCSQFGSMVCTVPRSDESPITVDPPHPCSQIASTACVVPVVDAPPVTVDPPAPCAQLGSMACTVPVVDAPPVTVDLPNTCTTATAAGGSCTIDPAPVATINPTASPSPSGGVPVGPPPGDLLDRRSPPGEILLLEANVLQRELTDPLASCADVQRDFPPAPGSDNETAIKKQYKEDKDCDPEGRRVNFVERVDTLADKITYDGMGYVPDVVALSEVSEVNARDIAGKLSTRTGFAFRVAVHAQDFADAEGLVRDTAILYNIDTMTMSGQGTAEENEHPQVKSKRYVMARFVERPLASAVAAPDGSQASVASPQQASLSVASVHYAFGFDSLDTAMRVKGRWASEIMNKLEFNHPGSDLYAVTGDFNEVRCVKGDAPREEKELFDADYLADEGQPVGEGYREPLLCAERDMHTTFAGRGYQDSVYMANARTSSRASDANGVPNIEALEPVGTLNQQYRDGLDRRRKFRIDHIFAKGATSYIAASYDLTCGEGDAVRDEALRNCDWLKNSDRYSDHTLVWGLLGANPKPSQDLANPEQ